MIEITEQMLADAGGWKEMKQARTVYKAGSVLSASFKDGLLEGTVKIGGRDSKVRLKIISPTNMENFCSCPRARREGIICGHALAVGLEYIKPTVTAPKSDSAPKKTPLSPDWPKFTEAANEKSVPAELFVILQPNVPSMWGKGRLMAGIEIEADGERSLLVAEKSGRQFYVGSRDFALVRSLKEITPTTVPGMMQLGKSDFLSLIENLAGHPRVTFGKKDPAKVAFQPMRLAAKVGKSIRVSWPVDVFPLVEDGKSIWAFLKSSRTFQPVAAGLPSSLRPIFHDLGLPISSLKAAMIPQIRRIFEVDDSEMPEVLRPKVRLEIEGSLNHLDANFSFLYTSPKAYLPDVFAEKAAEERLMEWGFDDPRQTGKLVLKDKARILQFFAHGYPKLPADWKITTGERFQHAENQVEPVVPEFEFSQMPSSGENWFAMSMEFATPSGDTVSNADIRRLLQMGQSSQKTTGGKIAVIDEGLIDELNNVISDCDPDQTAGKYKIGIEHADYLRDTASDAGVSISGKAPWTLEPAADATSEISDDLKEILRPYQETGVEWMRTLASRGMGGVLADDMGLGKTLQTLTFIHCAGGQALVVCPSSLVSNWAAEAEKFVPDLTVVTLEGPKRFERMEEAGDLFITSYALIRRDEEYYRDWGFTTVVLDEAQNIKNPEAKVTKAVHRLSGDFRFALTGTPIENSVQDLWSIMNFSMPGYLGSRKEFMDRFGSTGSQARLRRRIRPIILRRLKSEVAKDLPDKIEQVVYCDLKPAQQEVYEKILRESREMILDAEGGRKRMLALTALLRLRQTCCDLRLLGLKNIEEADASIKLDTLEELLTEAVEGNHRVLVFSQFVEMLQVLVPMLASRGLGYCYLDGSTKNRGDVVAKFQSDENIPVFLISLKAGGVGLNLTAADTVIHVDPWWNPAVEAQATDRAHRIGQSRVVTSYKLITRNTVEEKILALQNKKRETIKSLLDSPDADLGESGMSGSELMALFE